MIVRRIKGDLPSGEELVGSFDVDGPALGHHCGTHGASHRVADVGIRDRWARVQQHPLAHAGHHLACGGHSGEERHTAVENAHDLGVGLVDRHGSSAVESCQSGDAGGIPACGNRPVDLEGLSTLGQHGIGEGGQPEVDDLGRRGQCAD